MDYVHNNDKLDFSENNLCDVSNMALIKPMLKIMYFFIVNNTMYFLEQIC